MYYNVLLCITMHYLIMTVRVSGEYACASAFGYPPVRRISVFQRYEYPRAVTATKVVVNGGLLW